MPKPPSAGYRHDDYALSEKSTSYVVCELRYESQIAITTAAVLEAPVAREPPRDALPVHRAMAVNGKQLRQAYGCKFSVGKSCRRNH